MSPVKIEIGEGEKARTCYVSGVATAEENSLFPGTDIRGVISFPEYTTLDLGRKGTFLLHGEGARLDVLGRVKMAFTHMTELPRL